MHILKNNTSAREWIEGFPIGNGRLAAMVWDCNNTDIISLNQEWLWRGIYKDQVCTPVAHHLKDVRTTFKTKGCADGTKMAVEKMAGDNSIAKVDSYQPAGDIYFEFLNDLPFVSRELDIKTGISTVKRQDVISEFYVDCVKDVVVCKWTGTESFNAKLTFTRPEDKDAICQHEIFDNTIDFSCKIKNGTSYGVKIYYETDGEILSTLNGVHINNAKYVYVLADINIDTIAPYKKSAPEHYDFTADKSVHCHNFSSYMNKVSLDFSDCDELCEYSLEERIERMRSGANDNGLIKLFFDYARYLMISCSICASLPANLQGKWNHEIFPPWRCDYHFDINLQMNYWMCEPLGMADFVEPLVDYLVRIGKSSQKHAKVRYGCRGSLMPLSDSAWADGLPISREYGFWTGASSWMAQHLWWHYTYNNDISYLREKAYPFFKSVAEFYEDFLVEDETGELQFIPSQSPENRFVGGGDYDVSLCISSANDVQLCFDLLGYAIESATILGIDDDKVFLWKNIRKSLPEFKIGNDGRLLEWNEEKEEVEPGHKHLSHLYGVYPGEIFLKPEYKAQYDAAKKSFDYRISQGGGYTGWSRAWVACMYARFGEGEEFHKHLCHLATDFVTSSLLDLHPPKIFQIDGNFGAAAAVIEAVVSATGGKVHLCRAVPKNWENGSLCGIKVPGGHTLDVYWKSGKTDFVNICFGFSGEITLVCNGVQKTYKGEAGKYIKVEF